MKKSIKALLLSGLFGFTSTSFALSEPEAEDLADLTAVFVYLKNDCGYRDLPDGQIRRALVFFCPAKSLGSHQLQQLQYESVG